MVDSYQKKYAYLSVNGGGCSGFTYKWDMVDNDENGTCLLYTSPSPRDRTRSRMPSSA